MNLRAILEGNSKKSKEKSHKLINPEVLANRYCTQHHFILFPVTKRNKNSSDFMKRSVHTGWAKGHATSDFPQLIARMFSLAGKTQLGD